MSSYIFSVSMYSVGAFEKQKSEWVFAFDRPNKEKIIRRATQTVPSLSTSCFKLLGLNEERLCVASLISKNKKRIKKSIIFKLQFDPYILFLIINFKYCEEEVFIKKFSRLCLHLAIPATFFFSFAA